MKKRIIVVVILSILSVIIALTFLVASTQMPNKKNNGFVRNWLTNTISPLNENTIPIQINRIVGGTSSHLFFCGLDPQWILQTDSYLQPKDTLFFNIQASEKIYPNNVIVDSPNVYMYLNNISYRISGRVDTSYVDTIHLQTPLFTRSVHISSESLVIRGLDSTESKQTFKQINCVTGRINYESEIIPDKKDGGFSTDGFLKYDSLTKKVIYVEMYQNRFFCLDTTLQVLYKGTTIDTTNTNKVTITQVQADDGTRLMPASARQMINWECFASSGHLFIASNLRADNETLPLFNKNTTIDIYSISNGKYIGSFHIPNWKGKKPLAISAYSGILAVLYRESHVSTFKLNLPAT